MVVGRFPVKKRIAHRGKPSGTVVRPRQYFEFCRSLSFTRHRRFQKFQNEHSKYVEINVLLPCCPPHCSMAIARVANTEHERIETE